MTELRLLVTGRNETHVVASLRRAVCMLDDGAGDSAREIVVITDGRPRPGGPLDAATTDPRVRVLVSHGLDDAERLDLGLFLRPLPSNIAVVGNGGRWLADMASIAAIIARAGVGAVVVHDAGSSELGCVLRHGAVFAAGPLCASGGFAGDRHHSIEDRLDGLGFSTIVLPPETPAAESPVAQPLPFRAGARAHRHLAGAPTPR